MNAYRLRHFILLSLSLAFLLAISPYIHDAKASPKIEEEMPSIKGLISFFETPSTTPKNQTSAKKGKKANKKPLPSLPDYALPNSDKIHAVLEIFFSEERYREEFSKSYPTLNLPLPMQKTAAALMKKSEELSQKLRSAIYHSFSERLNPNIRSEVRQVIQRKLQECFEDPQSLEYQLIASYTKKGTHSENRQSEKTAKILENLLAQNYTHLFPLFEKEILVFAKDPKLVQLYQEYLTQMNALSPAIKTKHESILMQPIQRLMRYSILTRDFYKEFPKEQTPAVVLALKGLVAESSAHFDPNACLKKPTNSLSSPSLSSFLSQFLEIAKAAMPN